MEKKILIIDDNEQDRKIMQRFLRDAGYENVVFAETGKKGIAAAKKEKPDLVILDTILPDMDGFEICKEIKTRENSPKVIILTGFQEAIDKDKAKEAGADEYTVKTNFGFILISHVEKLLA